MNRGKLKPKRRINPTSRAERFRLQLYGIMRAKMIEANILIHGVNLPVCEACHVPINSVKDVEYDHILGRHTGKSFYVIGLLEPLNGQILCPRCHMMKTGNKDGCHMDYRCKAMEEKCLEMSKKLAKCFGSFPDFLRGQWSPGLYHEAFKKFQE